MYKKGTLKFFIPLLDIFKCNWYQKTYMSFAFRWDSNRFSLDCCFELKFSTFYNSPGISAKLVKQLNRFETSSTSNVNLLLLVPRLGDKHSHMEVGI